MPASKTFDLEKLVGVRLFAWLGGLGLFIGAAFFLQYSIEHDLISPPMRIGIGLLTGAVAVLARRFHPRKGRPRRSGARRRRNRDPLRLAFRGAHALRICAGSRRRLAPWCSSPRSLAPSPCAAMPSCSPSSGLLGGFATPVLLSTGEDHRYALFGYIGLLDAAVLFVAAKRKWMIAHGDGVRWPRRIIYAGGRRSISTQGGVPFALGVAAALSPLFAVGTLNRSGAPPLTTPLRTGLFGTALASPFIAALAAASQSDLSAEPDAAFRLSVPAARQHLRHGRALWRAIFSSR